MNPSISTDLAIGLINPKYARNVAAIIRAASCFGATHVLYSGKRVEEDIEFQGRLPREERMRGYADVEWKRQEKLIDAFEDGIIPVAVEYRENSESSFDFIHPPRALYIFGPEDGGLGRGTLTACQRFLRIPTRHCLNLATAVTIVLYDRALKRYNAGLVDNFNVPVEIGEEDVRQTCVCKT